LTPVLALLQRSRDAVDALYKMHDTYLLTYLCWTWLLNNGLRL